MVSFDFITVSYISFAWIHMFANDNVWHKHITSFERQAEAKLKDKQ